MYQDLPVAGISTVTLLGVTFTNSSLYLLLGISFILVAFRLIRLVHKENN